MIAIWILVWRAQTNTKGNYFLQFCRLRDEFGKVIENLSLTGNQVISHIVLVLCFDSLGVIRNSFLNSWDMSKASFESFFFGPKNELWNKFYNYQRAGSLRLLISAKNLDRDWIPKEMLCIFLAVENSFFRIICERKERTDLFEPRSFRSCLWSKHIKILSLYYRFVHQKKVVTKLRLVLK